ncbi:MAG: hypothetical protein QXY74_04840 [Candidatus Bathyarchaeia archaeon]
MAVIVGISDKHTVMADLDNMNFKRVKSLALLTMKKFRLNGFIILKSSPRHYHVVFDKPMRYWSSVLKVIAWMGIVGNNCNLWKWMCMQAIKGYCTLRVSPKPVNPEGVKPSPRVVYRYGSQENMVKEYLAFRKRVLMMIKRLGV